MTLPVPLVSSAEAFSPADYFGTKYSGFQNNAHAGLPRLSAKRVFDNAFITANVALPLGVRDKPIPYTRVQFMLSIMESYKRKSIVYDLTNRKIWIVSELSLALQMAHIWAAHQDDKDALLSKLPYAVLSTDGVSSAYKAIFECRDTVLRDIPSGSVRSFSDLMKRILGCLEEIQDSRIFSKNARNAVGTRRREGLIGWEIMDIALWEGLICARDVQVDKKTKEQVNRWQEEHPSALMFVGRNLQPHPPATPGPFLHRVPVDSKEPPSFPIVAEGTQSKGNDSGNRSPDVESILVDLDDAETASLASDNSSSRSSSPSGTVTSASSVSQLSVVFTESATLQLRRLLLDNRSLMLRLDTSVERRGIGPSRKSLRLSLNAFGRDLQKEAKTEEQTQAGVFVLRNSREVTDKIIQAFAQLNQHNLKSIANQQDRRKAAAPDDTALQGWSVPETAEEDANDSDEEFAVEQRDEELSSLENVKAYILESKAWKTLPDKLATLVAPINQHEDIGKKLEVPQPESLPSDITKGKGKDLERQADDQLKPARLKTLVSPDPKGLGECNRRLSPHGTEAGDEVNDERLHPLPPVPRDPATGPLLATRHTGEQSMAPKPIVAPKLDDKEKADPRQLQHANEYDGWMSHSLRPIPKGFIQRLDSGKFRVKTRNRCNDVFEDVVSVSTEEEASAFFRRIDRYDPLRGPIRKFNDKLLDLYWNFIPPIHAGPTMISSPEEGTEIPSALEQGSSVQGSQKQVTFGNVGPDELLSENAVPDKSVPDKSLLEPASSAVAVVGEEAGDDNGHNADRARDSPAAETSGTASPAVQRHVAPAPAAAAPNAVPNPSGGAVQPSPADQHKVFICLVLGRQGWWRLHYAQFEGQGNEPSQVTDEAIFRQVRTELGKFMKSRGYLRFVFPLCLSRVEYYEFTLYSRGANAVGIEEGHGEQGKLPSDHRPPPDDWRQRCPADKWYFNKPDHNTGEAEEIRDSLATATLTDAVRHRAEFFHNPGSIQYRKSVPWRLKDELTTDPASSPRGWGFVLRFEFDIFFFLCMWGTLAIVLSLGLLGLYVGPGSPAYDQPGAAVAIFMAPFGFVGTWFSIASAYAKQRKYLD